MKDILKVALSQYGVTEIKGKIDNPAVLKYFHETGRTWVNNDETPWCDAFLDWCAMKAGLKFTPGLTARAWLRAGEAVEPEKVTEMALEIPIICVLWRGEKVGIYGHVGLVTRLDTDSVWLLGGNQGIGQVNIRPFALHKVLGYRRLWL